jgi:hypothetical protein
MNRLLIKFPTRSRPALFFDMLKKYRDYSVNPLTTFLVAIDADDAMMNNPECIEKILDGKNIILTIGHSKNKMDAINRDVNAHIGGYDVLLLASDDMEPVMKGYDQIILDDMKEHFPKGDGCLWYDDSDQKRVCLLAVMGVQYYKKFNYIYHPAYQSMWGDNEWTEVAKNKNKLKYIHKRIIFHQRDGYGAKVPMDDLYRKNDALFWDDKKIYDQRRQKNYPLLWNQ